LSKGCHRKQRQRSSLLLTACIFFALAFFASPIFVSEVQAAGWYNASWQYRKQITIDNTKVSGTANLTNFPILINRTDIEWKDTVNGGKVGQPDGGDILFTKSDGITKLDHEIEKYVDSTGELVAWVNIDSLLYDTDTGIYIYYGNADAADQWNIEGTWDSNYTMVQHLHETSGTHYDSTSNNHDGTPIGSLNQNETGKINGADDFDGSDDVITTGVATSEFFSASTKTISAWLQSTGTSPVETAAYDGQAIISCERAYWGIFRASIGGDDRIWIYNWDEDENEGKIGITYNNDEWLYVTLVHNGGNLYAYKNGALVGSIASGDTDDITNNLVIGKNYYATVFFEGDIDETRTSNFARSGDWITTEYNNQSSPSTFYSVGPEETNAAPNAPTLVSPANGSNTNDDTPTLSANYSDPDAGDIGATNYRISSSSLVDCNNNTNIVASGTSAETSTNNEATTWTPGSSIGSDVTYYWCAQNDDGALTSSWTSIGNFILDSTAPSVPGIPAATIGTNLTSQDWTWTASTDAGSGVSQYLWRVDGGSSGSTTSPAVTTNLAEGEWKFYVKAEDNAGNQSAESSSLLAVFESSINKITIDCSVPVVYVAVGANVSNPQLDLTPLTSVSGELLEANLNCELRLKTVLPTAVVGVDVPAGIVISGPISNWSDKVIVPPTTTTTTNTALLPAGASTSLAVIIGHRTVPLNTTKGIRVFMEEQAGKKVGYISNNVFTEITSTCTDDSQATGDALSAGGNCKIDSGSDLIIWAKHFSDYITYDLAQSSAVSSSDTSSSAPGCGDQAPGAKAPWLYGAIPQDGSSILLYFTPSDNPVNKYVLEYGTKPGDYSYGVQDMGLNSRGQMTFLVKSLAPNTTYYFRVRGGNGCATGPWSNEISAKTKGFIAFNQLEITQSELESQPVEESCQTYTVKSGDSLWLIAKNLLGDGNRYKEIIEQNKDKYSSLETSTALQTGWELKINCPSSAKASEGAAEKPEQQQGYDVKVKVVDTNKKPIEGAKVTIHSKIQETTTNKDGVAEFKNVEAGDHRVLIAYKNFEGEQSVNLTGDVKEFDLNVTVQQKAISLSPLAYGIIGIMGLIIIVLAVLLNKLWNTRK